MTAAKTKSKADSSFNAARILASIAIVWVHTPRSEALVGSIPVGVFGTSFFAAAAMFFMARSLWSDPSRGFVGYSKKRLVRLGTPFLTWTAFYFVFRNVCRVFIEHKSVILPNPAMLLVGSELQLWFLPFLLLASIIVFPMVKFASRSARNRHVTGWLMGVAGVVVAAQPLPHFHGSEDIARFQTCVWFVLPCVLWGLTIAMNYDLLSSTVFRSRWTTIIGAILTVASMVSVYHTGSTVIGKNVGGLGWLLVSLSMPSNRLWNMLAKIAPLGFGLYLTHPFFQGMLRAFAKLAHRGPTATNDVVLFALTVAGALSLSWMLRKNTTTAWLVM